MQKLWACLENTKKNPIGSERPCRVPPFKWTMEIKNNYNFCAWLALALSRQKSIIFQGDFLNLCNSTNFHTKHLMLQQIQRTCQHVENTALGTSLPAPSGIWVYGFVLCVIMFHISSVVQNMHSPLRFIICRAGWLHALHNLIENTGITNRT